MRMKATFSGPCSAIARPSFAMSMLPLKGAPPRDQGLVGDEVEDLRPDELDVDAGRREVVVGQHDLGRLQEDLDEEVLGGAALMDREGVVEAEDVLHRPLQLEKLSEPA